jgi:hypothetical protein
VLDLTGVLESRVDNGSRELRLEEEVLETGRVNGDVMSLLGVLRGRPFGGNAAGILRGDVLRYGRKKGERNRKLARKRYNVNPSHQLRDLTLAARNPKVTAECICCASHDLRGASYLLLVVVD